MDRGNWLPLSKGLANDLPRDRGYSPVEAAFSLQLDYDGGNEVTLSGYASLWGWSKDKVRRFLSEMGVEIIYPESTGRRRNQRGTLRPSKNRLKPDQKSSENRLKRFINSKHLDDPPDCKSPENRLKTDQTSYATKDPKPNPEKKPSSDALRLSGLLANLIAGNNPSNREIQPSKKEHSVQRWAKDIERMLRRDSRSPEEVEAVIEWCQDNPFWRGNILSGSKLREKFDKLTLQMQQGPKTNRGVDPVADGRRVY